jgi:hypothetical protein
MGDELLDSALCQRDALLPRKVAACVLRVGVVRSAIREWPRQGRRPRTVHVDGTTEVCAAATDGKSQSASPRQRAFIARTGMRLQAEDPCGEKIRRESATALTVRVPASPPAFRFAVPERCASKDGLGTRLLRDARQS